MIDEALESVGEGEIVIEKPSYEMSVGVGDGGTYIRLQGCVEGRLGPRGFRIGILELPTPLSSVQCQPFLMAKSGRFTTYKGSCGLS